MLAGIAALDAQLHEAAQPLGRAEADIVRLSLEGSEIGGGFWKRIHGRWDDCANARAIAALQPALAGASGAGAAALSKVDELLRRKAEVLQKARRQIHITALLEAWLFVHIPATFALLAALAVHIISVFLYW